MSLKIVDQWLDLKSTHKFTMDSQHVIIYIVFIYLS